MTDPAEAVALQLEARDARTAALIHQVARGDEAAFADLFRLLSPAILGLVRRVLRDPAQSEEVTQEVFVEIWRTASRFDAEKGSVNAWITTLAHRRAVDRVRSEQSRTDRQLKVTATDPVTEPAADAEVLDAVETDLDARRVRHALDSLTALQREAVELAFYRGYTHPQVAQLLDVPLGTVKTRIRDGLIRLRDQLGVTA